MKRIRGFTLIELLVVIAIIGILSGFIAVSLNGAIDAANDVKKKATIDQLRKALQVCAVTNGGLYPIETTNCTVGTNCPTLAAAIVPNCIGTLPSDGSVTYQSVAGTDFTLSSTLSNATTYSYTASTGFSAGGAVAVGPINYSRRIPITITNSSGEVLTDYQMSFNVTYDSDMKSDFSDLAFIASDGSTALSYWIESYSSSTSAVVWVKVNSLTTGANTIYMYYKNPSAVTASNPDSTFILYDDFLGSSVDTSKWNVMQQNGGTFTVSGGLGNAYTPAGTRGAGGLIASKGLISPGSLVEIKATMALSGYATYGILGYINGFDPASAATINDYITLQDGSSSDTLFYFIASHNGTAVGVATASSCDAASKTFKIAWTPALISSYVNGTIIGSSSNTAIIPTTEQSFCFGGSTINPTRTEVPSPAKHHYVDWVRIRKYVSSEPTSVIGSEQTSW